MTAHNLTSDENLLDACRALGSPDKWSPQAPEWIRQLSETISWVRSASQAARTSREFQERLWERNHVAAVGQGNIPITRALDDEAFRNWFAERSMHPLPPSGGERLAFLNAFYTDLKARLAPFLDKKIPHLKMFRVMAALYPEAMTSIASAGALSQLTRSLGATSRLEPVERHVWTRDRLDRVLGPCAENPMALAERLSLPWMLYERFVQAPADVTQVSERIDEAPKLVPLPAVRRRRGLSAYRGLFPAVLSTLEFVRDGVTRTELVEFLRAASPETKTSSLGVVINSLQSELGVIRTDGSRYFLTERGEDVLESQDPTDLADWILTRILGADRALVELREHGPMPPAELVAAIRSMNPGWTTNFGPQVIVGWFRSMGVIETTADDKHALTELGRQWAGRIHWTPEPLPPDVPPTPPVKKERAEADVTLPVLSNVVKVVQEAGQFSAAVVAQLHAGVWAHRRRHFAVLTGLSGAGKTLLARAYAKALAAGAEDRLLTVPVQPGWYDPGPLLGYVNPLRQDEYVRTPFLEFLTRAASDGNRPYVVVLDEMNLSHPEQYMAPLLSAMETGDDIRLHCEGEILDGIPDRLPYPSNLVFIGTVNMDETTHGLADKVLDRAFVLEFWHVNLDDYPRWGKRQLRPTDEDKTRQLLGLVMAALAPVRLHFGWRVVDDVLDFLERAAAGDSLPFDAALDAVIYAKILPKLRGEDSGRLREALSKCEAAFAAHGLDSSRSKVSELRYNLETTGSARFWR